MKKPDEEVEPTPVAGFEDPHDSPAETGKGDLSEEEAEKEYQRGIAHASGQLKKDQEDEDPDKDKDPDSTEKPQKGEKEKDPPGTSDKDTTGQEGEDGSAQEKDPTDDEDLEGKFKKANEDLENKLKKAKSELRAERGRTRALSQRRPDAKPGSTDQKTAGRPQSRQKIDTALKEYEEVDPDGAAKFRGAFDGIFEEMDDLKGKLDRYEQKEEATEQESESQELEGSMPGWNPLVLEVGEDGQGRFTEQFQEYFETLPPYKQKVLTTEGHSAAEWIDVIQPWYDEQNPDKSASTDKEPTADEALAQRRAAQRRSAKGGASKSAALTDISHLGNKGEADEYQKGMRKAQRELGTRRPGKRMRRKLYGRYEE